MAQTAMQMMLEELMDNEYTIPISLIVKCKGLIEVERQNMINAMMYTFHQQNTLPYGMEYLLKRDEINRDCLEYYNETYNNGL